MIIVSGTIVMNPAHADRALELTGPLVAETRQEAGCRSYGFYAALDEPGRYHLHEEWESQDALDRHSTSAHLAAFYASIGELDISHVELFQYEVASESRIM